MIDATIVRAHACTSGYGKNSQDHDLRRNKGAFTTKIHAIVGAFVDAFGNPVKLILTPGQRDDITQVGVMTDTMNHATVIADQSYESALIESPPNRAPTAVISKIEKYNVPMISIFIKSTISSSKLTAHGDLNHFCGYRQKRWCSFFDFRRVFSRFDKTANSFMASLLFVGALIWLRQFFLHRAKKC